MKIQKFIILFLESFYKLEREMGGKYKEWWLTRLKNRNSWIDAVAHQVKQLQASLASHGTNLSPSWFTSNPFLCQCACESSSGWLKLLGLRGRPWKSSWPRSVVVALRMNQKMENFCLFLSFFNSAFQINKTELKKKKKKGTWDLCLAESGVAQVWIALGFFPLLLHKLSLLGEYSQFRLS